MSTAERDFMIRWSGRCSLLFVTNGDYFCVISDIPYLEMSSEMRGAVDAAHEWGRSPQDSPPVGWSRVGL